MRTRRLIAAGALSLALCYLVLHCLQFGFQRGARDRRPMVFNVGMPKAGSTSLANYLSCVGYDSVSHWHCDGGKSFSQKRTYCGQCISRAITRNVSLDKECGYHSAYTQMDREEHDCSFPQILHLDYLDAWYENAKFIYIRREPEAWISSLRKWRRNMHIRMLRCMHILNIVDLSTEISSTCWNGSECTGVQLWKSVYKKSKGDQVLRSVVHQHERNVWRKFADRPNDLLFVNLTDPVLEEKINIFLNVAPDSSQSGCWGQYNHI